MKNQNLRFRQLWFVPYVVIRRCDLFAVIHCVASSEICGPEVLSMGFQTLTLKLSSFELVYICFFGPAPDSDDEKFKSRGKTKNLTTQV